MHARRRSTGLALLLAWACSACTGGSGSLEMSPSPPTIPAPVSASPIPGTVRVVVSGLEDERGSELAGVLFLGDGTDPDKNAVGGFSVVIDADPFSTTQLVHPARPRSPAHPSDAPFPYVTDEVVSVEPGAYTLDLWVADRVTPYSRWVPASSPSLEGCATTLLMEEGRGTVVTLTDPVLVDAPFGGDLPTC